MQGVVLAKRGVTSGKPAKGQVWEGTAVSQGVGSRGWQARRFLDAGGWELEALCLRLWSAVSNDYVLVGS